MAPDKTLEIAIIGGGISGLTLAIALHHRRLNVKIYEQAPRFGEIGAGVSFTPNAVQAMKHCYGGIYDAFTKIRTGNLWPSKQTVWFDYHDGFHDLKPDDTHAFSIASSLGQAGIHRAKFLDELVKLLPGECADFGKRLEDLTKGDDGRWVMRFADGSSATADAIIGCDGIKSKVRQLLYGKDHPCAHPTYTHKYAYRALADMKDAIQAVGEEKAQNACMHMGKSGHVLTFPVNHGQTVNIVAFHTTQDDWPDYNRLTRPAKREDALRDFADFGHDVTNLLQLCKRDLDIWAIFHLGDNPVPKYNKGSICLIGDAAHATSPHHGAGAGMCIEDSAIMVELLADDRVRTQQDIEAAFAVFHDQRHDRGNWLVQSSQHIGNCYEWLADGIGDDLKKVEQEINTRNSKIADVDVPAMCRQAKEVLGRRIASTGKL